MTFLESRISPRITAETTFAVEQPARTKVYFENGSLHQNFGGLRPKHTVNMALGVRSASDFQELVDAFYVLMFTPYEGLRVKNWQDYRATAANSTVAALGGGVYQLQRKHIFGGFVFARDITKPVNNGSLVVFNASGTPLTSTLDYTAGRFTVASGTPAYWTGEFDLPMTFSDDVWTARLEVSTANLHLVNEPILLEELLP